MEYSRKAREVKESPTLALSARAQEMRAAGRHIINFTVGEPDFDTPEYIKAAAIKAIEDGFTKYTASSGTAELREAICAKLRRDNGLCYAPPQIVVSNGAKHSLANVFTAILNDGDEVLLPAPYWLSYVEQIKLAGGVPVIVTVGAEDGYLVNASKLEEAVTAKTKALLINSPNNPSGMVYPREALTELAAFAKERGLLVISDEIYEKLIYDGTEHVSIASLSEDALGRTIVINGFSKTYAMTGWRVGYCACPEDLAAIIGNVQSHTASNVNSVAQKAATAALLEGDSAVAAMTGTFASRRDMIFEGLSVIGGITALKPQGAFYAFADISALLKEEWARAKGVTDAAAFAAKLLEECGVAVVPCADFGFPNHIRITYAVSAADIDEGMKLLGDFARGLKN